MKYLTKEFTSSDTNVPMIARLVRPGEGYGKWDEKNHEFLSGNQSNELVVEFYDARYNHAGPIEGQFISRYNLSTLEEVGQDRGLCLDGGVPDWNIGKKEFGEVVAWAERLREKMGVEKGKPLDFGSSLGR